MSADDIPISLQELVISSGLNSTLLAVLLLGIYTMVYLGATYLYYTRSSSHHWMVICTITLLYLTYVLQWGFQWYLLNWSMIKNGETRESVFSATASGIRWATYVDDICTFLESALADGLLIWRCFNLWNRSLRVISFSLLLFLVEIGLYMSLIIIVPMNKFEPSNAESITLNRLIIASLFMTLSSTLVTTFLIGYRIYGLSEHRRVDGTWRRFKSILEILVQSSAAYSLATLAYAIAVILPDDQTVTHLAPLFAVEFYAGVIFSFTAGVATTVMVARVTVSKAGSTTDNSTITHISGLQFEGHSTQS